MDAVLKAVAGARGVQGRAVLLRRRPFAHAYEVRRTGPISPSVGCQSGRGGSFPLTEIPSSSAEGRFNDVGDGGFQPKPSWSKGLTL